MIAGLTAEALANKGMTLTGTCDAAKPAFESACFRATQQAMGQQYQKWLLIVMLPNETGMVVVTVPEAALGTGAYSSADFDTALATLAYGDSATADPLTTDRKSTRLKSSHSCASRMTST